MTTHVLDKVLVTGGSGFIGTNLVNALLNLNKDVLSIDIEEPKVREHRSVFKQVDILDAVSLSNVLKAFSPRFIVHLAARTDLHEKSDINGYQANIAGVKNIIEAIRKLSSLERCVFISTKLVCPTDYVPQSSDDYCPDTLYGKSKVLGEELIKKSDDLSCTWCIARPTSIWGPWSMAPHIPYGKFFQMVARGLYLHPGKYDPPRSFGYVGNSVFQIIKLMDAPGNMVHKKVFYLSDYEKYTIRQWANLISLKTRNKTVSGLPEFLVQLAARCGDLLKYFGYSEPPFSTFRLKNMRADTSSVPLEEMKEITGALPYTLVQGVDETLHWLKQSGYIKCSIK